MCSENFKSKPNLQVLKRIQPASFQNPFFYMLCWLSLYLFLCLTRWPKLLFVLFELKNNSYVWSSHTTSRAVRFQVWRQHGLVRCVVAVPGSGYGSRDNMKARGEWQHYRVMLVRGHWLIICCQAAGWRRRQPTGESHCLGVWVAEALLRRNLPKLLVAKWWWIWVMGSGSAWVMGDCQLLGWIFAPGW